MNMSDSSSNISVGFIGAGMMASALVDGLVSKKVVESPACIACSDVWEPALRAAADKGMLAVPTNEEVCMHAKSVIVLAVKPNMIGQVCRHVASVPSTALVVSIAAGIPLKQLEESLPGRRIVRVMPNTPCLVGESACAFSPGRLVTDQDRETVKSMFGAVGMALEVDEKSLDAVTGLSGSGPAYVFQFIEALSDGGVRSGLPRAVATQLAAQTVKGAAEMVLQTSTHPALLKDGVASPGGTTIAGLEALEKGGFRAATISAVMASTKRSMQLAGISKEDIENKHGL